jgi:hypothetical protein
VLEKFESRDSYYEANVSNVAYWTGKGWSRSLDAAQGYALKQVEDLARKVDPEAEAVPFPSKDGNYVVVLTDQSV